MNDPFDNNRQKVRMEGAAAAVRGRKPDANPYLECSDLHCEWRAGWTAARVEMLRMRKKAPPLP